MGTAFGVCFGYWLGGAAFFYSVAFMCSTHLTFLQILSLSVSVCLLLSEVKVHTVHFFLWP